MKLIKLDAIDSTNDFLKKAARQETLENFTVVTAQNQTKGKGQMGAIWNSESGKNLIMSFLVRFTFESIEAIFLLNAAVALAVAETLQELSIPNISIKWPNDILSDSKKVCGILIENSFKNGVEIESIIGIGINVNQQSFENLPKASSLARITQKEYDVDALRDRVLFHFQKHYVKIVSSNSAYIWENYHALLFKINVPMPFEDAFQQRFMGIIKGVSTDGTLQVLLENDSIASFGIKEIQLLY
ncbi:biotin--[acetyl-CoA-carboxylase] ligase [Flavobacterium aciduliphilum]|nr:biotin--[acetyl-CoA-carboxylase] ligase [Flavobacterium aciduliphilum]